MDPMEPMKLEMMGMPQMFHTQPDVHAFQHQLSHPQQHQMQHPLPLSLHQQQQSQQQSLHQQQLQQQQQQHLQQDSQDRSRAYKSRNKRPCDFCRYKKAACHLDDKPPCELCVRYGKECTFVESPAKRRRPNEEQQQRNSIDQTHPDFIGFDGNAFGDRNSFDRSSFDMSNELLSWEQPVQPFMPDLHPLSTDFDFPSAAAYEPLMFEQFDPIQAGLVAQPAETPVSLPRDDGNAEDPSLDMQSSSNALLVGFSGEADPYLLRHYKYDHNNECAFQQIRMRRVGDNDGIPVHFMIQQNKLASKAQPTDKSEKSEALRVEVMEMVPDEVGKRLIDLYFRYIQPYYPVLSRQRLTNSEGEIDPEQIPTHLLAAIYGHALQFCVFDDELCVEVYTPPSTDDLFGLAWAAVMPKFHTPSLSVVQTLLLMVQRRPTNKFVADTPTKWIMMTTCVGIAQSLGLNMDPRTWLLPLWEQRLRRRLAWAVFSQDKWLSLNFGRSSHIVSDDWDVDTLQPTDFEEDDYTNKGAAPAHFLQLCVLSQIIDDALRDLFSIRATRSLSHSLEATLEIAKPLRVRLTEWFQTLPTELSSTAPPRKAHELNGHGSLHLAYITAKIELFRAMLRPSTKTSNTQASIALRTGAVAVAVEVFDFLECLDASHLEAFWPSYARTNFTIASNFILLLFASCPHVKEAQESFRLLNSWRALLRIKSRSSNLLNLALLRLDATYVAGVDKLIELSPAALQVFQEHQAGKA